MIKGNYGMGRGQRREGRGFAKPCARAVLCASTSGKRGMAQVRRPHLGSTEHGVGPEFGEARQSSGVIRKKVGCHYIHSEGGRGTAPSVSGSQGGRPCSRGQAVRPTLRTRVGCGPRGSVGAGGGALGAPGVCTEYPGGGEPRGPEDRG